jgi:uncharacterized membrane protein
MPSLFAWRNSRVGTLQPPSSVLLWLSTPAAGAALSSCLPGSGAGPYNPRVSAVASTAMIVQRSDPVPPFACEFLLRPNRSLSARGLAVCFAGLATVGIAVAVASAGQGNRFAPAFAVAELLLVGVCLRLASRRLDRQERIVLAGDGVVVEREPGAARFDPYWVRVERRPGERPGDERLVLASHGRAVEIGAFLGADERGALERDLRQALATLRRPAGYADGTDSNSKVTQ